jgi:hypothetical protein
LVEGLTVVLGESGEVAEEVDDEEDDEEEDEDDVFWRFEDNV